ncbi:hypothetical protein [Nitrosopumilus ureiphilus]|uniref:Uncharacterized protein n=1 Tax=Nitrosopumilus ureiphilus TaxID=1470067 RepID=A0A7D5RGP6_9ARCH|nr:hypothetical protein [Nitrosopumilus ureiphilus]QLH07065.1 hypothetical protein C5F50_08285 [Nitrosopumilus ureiphilus]
MDKISRKAKGTQLSYKIVLNNWEIFSEEKFRQKDIIPDLKIVDEETLWDTLQSWINWNSERDNMPQTIKHWFSLLKKYLYYRGIKLTKEDVSENLDFPLKIEESHYPPSLEVSIFKNILICLMKISLKKHTVYWKSVIRLVFIVGILKNV